MPKIVSPLSLAQIKSLKPKEKLYKKSDGGTLGLSIGQYALDKFSQINIIEYFKT